MIQDYETKALRPFDFDNLLLRIPEINQLDCDISTYSFQDPIDSTNMSLEEWVAIAEVVEANYEDYDGFVILHGSDTMSYSASTLSFMLEGLQKPVIFTGSQLPIGYLRTDAKENLITAVEIASSATYNGEPVREVGLYFEYKLYRGNRTTKISAEHFEAFTSPNYPPLGESGVHLKINEDLLLKPVQGEEFKVFKQLNANVAVLKLFPGITPQVVEAICRLPSLKGLVLETYGAGNAPSEAWFVNLLEGAINRGVKVVNITQCAIGAVAQGHYEVSSQLKRMGVISGKDMTTEAALSKLMYMLGKEINAEDFEEMFERPIRGEVS